MSLSDQDLVARVLVHHDRQAYGELVLRHQSAVRRFLRHLTHGDYAWADDLAQEAFLRAYKNLAHFRGDSSFCTWVFGIAHNQFRNARRRSRHEAMDTAPEEVVPAENERIDLREDLSAALRQLSSEEQTALHLCFQQGLTHPEAADVMQVPLGTIKTLILRSKEKLRSLLAVWNPQT